MGVYSRLSDIVNSNVHALLDKAEDPAKMVRLIIQEMEDTLVEVRSASVKTLARQKEINRELKQFNEGIAEWEAKAELAMSKDREDLARGALMYKNQLVEKRDLLAEEQQIAKEQVEKLDSDIRQLNAKLKDAKARQRSLLMRKDNAGTRLKAKQQMDDARLDDARTKFEAFERRIEGLEAQVEAEELGQGDDLEKAFSELEANDEVEAELARLRKKLKPEADS
ncbi:phage shock protein A, PspA [Oceanococcus atlanticus]|uniref:Phage shock protein A, PspA n=1 Tax=Oceanococcus atlanticus TaxID=1317117 RepID=A0A1Y1SC30_9GAMM|nr:phage shock protein PspA [Oceanococcus atlanticus]ORE86171.1 phage shock protein A, PspA [Oceanococcus atlanticus]